MRPASRRASNARHYARGQPAPNVDDVPGHGPLPREQESHRRKHHRGRPCGMVQGEGTELLPMPNMRRTPSTTPVSFPAGPPANHEWTPLPKAAVDRCRAGSLDNRTREHITQKNRSRPRSRDCNDRDLGVVQNQSQTILPLFNMYITTSTGTVTLPTSPQKKRG